MQDTIGIKDFITRTSSYGVVTPDARMHAKVKRRYKNILQSAFPLMSGDPFVSAEHVFNTAKQLLQRDGHHIHLLCLQSPDKTWSVTSPRFQDQTAKYIFWHDVAERVRREGITAVIFAGECWLGTLDTYVQTGQRASQQADRREGLMVDAFTSALTGKSYHVRFHRSRLGKVIFDEEFITDDADMSAGYIKPVADVWREAAPAPEN